MILVGPLLERLQNAILAAFNRDELRLLLRYRLNVDFEAIVPDGNLAVQVHDLLLWANRHNRVDDLVFALLAERPNNAELQATAAAFRADKPASAEGSPNPSSYRGHMSLQRPPRTQRFTGRQAELAQLLADLQPGRVVTLTGPGGIGKSALAAEAVWTLAPCTVPPELYPDGIVFHSFYHQPQSALALEKIAQAYRLESKSSVRDAALQALAGRQALLVLDGTEETDDLDAVLAVAGSCGVLITTRQRQQAPDTWQNVAQLSYEDSRALLRSWAGQYAADDDAAGEIVHLLGGLPLALALTGRYLAQQQQPAAEFAAWLQEEGLTTLHFAARSHKSIPLLLRRSLDQVSSIAQDAFGVAGVLALAPFERDEIAAALDLKPGAAVRALGELVDYGLLLHTADGYNVSHALAHTYARTHAPPDPQAVERLAWHYSAWVQKESFHGLAEAGRLDRQRAHIVAVQAAALSREQWMPVIALAWSLRTYLDLRAHTVDRVRVMQAGLDAARAAGIRRDEEAFLNSLGLAYVAQGSFQQGIDLFQQRLKLAKQWADLSGQQIAFSNLGTAYAALGQYPRAVFYFKRVLKLAQRAGERNAIGSASGNLGGTYIRLGKVQEALPLFNRQLAIASELRQRREESNALGNLAIAYAHLGQMDRVVELLEQQLLIARELGDRHSEGIALGNLGGAYADLGDLKRAIAQHEQYLAIARETHDPMGQGVALGNLGKEYAALGDTQRAIDIYEQSLTIARAIGDRQTEAVTSWNLGLAYEKEGDLVRAITHLQARVDYERAVGHPEAAAHAEHVGDVQTRLSAGGT